MTEGAAWAILFLPLASFALIAFGIRPFFNRYDALSGYVTILAIGAAFALSVMALAAVWDAHGAIGWEPHSWMVIGELEISIGILMDPLTAVLLVVISGVSLLVQVYSQGYMRGDPGYSRYFAFMSLFTASMLGLVLARNVIQLYFFWELVGLCSYLLIGFWYNRPSAAAAAKKAFIVTRLGDVGFLLAILYLFFHKDAFISQGLNPFEISHINIMAAGGEMAGAQIVALGGGVITWVALGIFAGAVGKSAQFPLHVWLPDAMEGPTPVSALIHAATMVVAGVFLVARLYPMFVESETAMLTITIVGLVTALITAAMALVMTDLKRVLAYSTVSHLGLMMLTLGCFGFTAALLHMVAHAFAKALLFLGAGSISHGTETEERPEGARDIRQMGGLYKVMPITAITFAIGALSLGGIPLLGGFFSKDEVLVAVLHDRGAVFFAATLLVALLSALYMARLLWVVVLGNLKQENEHAHESPFVMTAPLALLAALAMGSGLLAVGGWWPGFDGLGGWLFHDEPHPYKVNAAVMAASVAIAAAGFGAGWAMYGRGVESRRAVRGRRREAQRQGQPPPEEDYPRYAIPSRLQRQFSGLHTLVINKFYVDDVYQWVIDRVALALANFMALFDRVVVNDTGVNGTGRSVMLSALALKLLQTGKVYNYALGMAIGSVIVALVWWLALPRL